MDTILFFHYEKNSIIMPRKYLFFSERAETCQRYFCLRCNIQIFSLKFCIFLNHCENVYRWFNPIIFFFEKFPLFITIHHKKLFPSNRSKSIEAPESKSVFERSTSSAFRSLNYVLIHESRKSALHTPLLRSCLTPPKYFSTYKKKCHLDLSLL